ncbi:MAG: hypothetical protein A2V52_04940 [Actinobacteria bacterium RBG_19FT_COMBO_54_7]|uniref:Uncharacterized protein n=1 Tax=Candidatus Solincola sediminis TaxID=1797199 RepID=A0A1F2WRI6_9ACTN|nr:MAG: hypothetical protein A2Y75_11430 [Candidatus Solincola sediminis]OFW59908.1 MAG: hypothetical protein A2W01_07170 [Candidatus Solincola sediminis]OFW69935.1 MAG: hypothetical protein A2V52_04940 [Actinobacteria bacterium RBG_19FT_COMBO_54_7]
MNEKINISIGSPIKRIIDGVLIWREEHALKAWIRLMKSVRKHRKLHRRFVARQKRIKRLEFEEWRRQQEEDELRGKLPQLNR